MWTTFDAIGEITLTTKGKDSDPSTAITTVSRDAAVLMLGMAKEDIGWDSWKLGQGILGPNIPTSLSQIFNVSTNPKMKKGSVCVGDKTSRWDYRKGVVTTGKSQRRVGQS
jgi:hypothetical protein